MKLDVESDLNGVKAMTLQLNEDEWDKLRSDGSVVSEVDMRGTIEVTVVLPFMKGARKAPQRKNDPEL